MKSSKSNTNNSTKSGGSSGGTTKEHYYATDAATLLDKCRRGIHCIFNELQKDGRIHNVNHNLLDLDRTLLSTEQLLHYHVSALLEREIQANSNIGGLVQQPNLSGNHGLEFGHHQEDLSSVFRADEQSVGNANTEDDQSSLRTSNSDDSVSTSATSSLMKTVHKLKKVTKQNNTRKRSLSFHDWYEKKGKKSYHSNGTRRKKPVSTITKPLLVIDGSSGTSSPSVGKKDDMDIPWEFTKIPNDTVIIEEMTKKNEKGPATIIDSRVHNSPNLGNSNRSRSALDSLLFRLIVSLQLCFVRIEEASVVLCRKDLSGCDVDISTRTTQTTDIDSGQQDIDSGQQDKSVRREDDRRHKKRWIIVGAASAIATSTYVLTKDTIKSKTTNREESTRAIMVTGSKAAAVVGVMALRRLWRVICVNARVVNTILSIEDWQQQWMLMQSVGVDTTPQLNDSSNISEIDSEDQCKRLLQLIPLQTTKSSIWDPQAAFRYGLIRRIMDTLYASVGTAIQITRSYKRKNNNLLMPITAAAAASYYALIGPGHKSAQVVSSKASSSDLIRNAWGVVSLPAVKTLSLQASRLLKGAAIAERIVVSGVSCFVLSKDPCPVLDAAIRRLRRQEQRDATCQLSTIFESSSSSLDSETSFRRFDLNDYPKKDVILHLTGGGFFAHTIAGDVPYLMDWSAETKAVIICPEYALLPTHTFPTAINEVTQVYTSLINGDSAPKLGFQTDRIIVTGESTGGNLAAALCVKLCEDGLVDVEHITAKRRLQRATEAGAILSRSISTGSDDSSPSQKDPFEIRLPDAIMLCCPALNLSLELSPSRVIGTRDPVLPSSLISTISDAYVPPYLGIDKTNPLASPIYASDDILQIFPPTLLYASSEDPLLDDSVHFNARLRRLGVESDLRAAQNMPHAYWGLGTAGFPEARQVQRECQKWMVKQLNPYGDRSDSKQEM